LISATLIDNEGRIMAASSPSRTPVEPGQKLAGFPRNRGDEELRVELRSYEGHSYIDLRVWVKARDGRWIATPKGTSIRVGELGGVIGVLKNALDILDHAPRGRSEPPSRPETERVRRAVADAPSVPTSTGPASAFDEFGESL
jgi:hypothetical protein